MERPRWNLKELRDHVHRNCDDRQSLLAFISSLDWADQVFRYHFSVAREALKRIPLDADPDSISNFEALFNMSEESSYAFLELRANISACIHTIRNAYEHFAQLCNAILLLPRIPVEDCTLYKVRTRLPPSQLRTELDLLSEDGWFKYVVAYTNTSKHRSLVQQSMHLSFADGVTGIRIEGFTHDKHYPPQMIGDLLEGVLGVKNQIISCGIALNDQVTAANA